MSSSPRPSNSTRTTHRPTTGQELLEELHADSQVGAAAAAAEASKAEMIRATFDLPQLLADPEADTTLTTAIEDLEAGAVDAAVERLQATSNPRANEGVPPPPMGVTA